MNQVLLQMDPEKVSPQTIKQTNKNLQLHCNNLVITWEDDVVYDTPDKTWKVD